MDKVQPFGAVDVHRGAQLALGEGFRLAEIRCRHAPVGEGDLHVERHRDDVRQEDEGDADGPRGQRAEDKEVAKDEPVAEHENNLGRSDPPSFAAAEGGGLPGEHMEPRQKVEVEAGESHDGVVGVGLVGDHDVGHSVPDEGEIVVVGDDALEEIGRRGKDGHVLNVRVALLGVCQQHVLGLSQWV